MKKWKCLVFMLAVMMLFASAFAEGSWGQINQDVSRADGWQAYVQDSPYHLGSGTAYAQDPEITLLGYGNYPSIDGSTVCVPMAMELARQLLSMREEDLNGFVAFSTTHYAYERLIGGKPNPTVLIKSRNAMMDPTQPVQLFLGTAPSEEECAMADAAGVHLIMTPVCYDAFVFLVNRDNPVSGMTQDQIRAVYSDQIGTWDELGGDLPLPIKAYQRPKNSGSQTAMEEMVMKGAPMIAQSNYISDGMGDLVAQIGNYTNAPDAIGYSYLFYVDQLYHSGNIKVLNVDGIAPTADALRSGAYPYTVCYYAVYREGDTQTKAFVDFMTSMEGQRAIAQAGYIPYIDLGV